MREIRTSGSMSGEGKRSDATAPLLDSTCLRGHFTAPRALTSALTVHDDLWTTAI